MHGLEDLFLCLANILALQRGARHRRHVIARQDVQVLQELSKFQGHRGLARARWPNEDHMIVRKNVCRLSAVGLGLQNDGLELVQHLHDVIHVVQVGKRVAR